MAKFPEPPPLEELARCEPEWRSLPRGTRLWRVYFRGGEHPTAWNELRRFGPTNSRFDHHEPPPRVQERGILYAAGHGPSALAEVFQATRLIDRTARTPWLVAFDLAAPLRLLDLTGRWPTRAGASMAIHSGRRDRARRWSRAIHETLPEAQGLFYASSMDSNRPLVAIYERGEAALPPRPVFHRALADPTLHVPLREAARELGYAMI